MAIREGDLVFPALKFIVRSGDAGVSTAELLLLLREQLELDADDLRPLEGRNDDRFSQIVRNLKSHDTLEKLEYAIHVDGRYYATDEGVNVVAAESENVDLLYSQGFDQRSLADLLKNQAGHLVVEEGQTYNLKGKGRKRSRIVRKAALAHIYKNEGKVVCSGCGYDPVGRFGDEALSLIEIHHTQPVSLLPESGLKKKLADVLETLVPLCALCHRITHLDKHKMLTLDELHEKLAPVGEAGSSPSG